MRSGTGKLVKHSSFLKFKAYALQSRDIRWKTYSDLTKVQRSRLESPSQTPLSFSTCFILKMLAAQAKPPSEILSGLKGQEVLIPELRSFFPSAGTANPNYTKLVPSTNDFIDR